MHSSKIPFHLDQRRHPRIGFLIVRIGSSIVIRQIYDLIDFRHCSSDNRFNILPECEIRGSATLTSSMKSEIEIAISDINNLDGASMFGYAGINLGVEEVLELLLRILPQEHHLFLNLFTR